jgi:4-amino-4-deoxychorismate lyase
MLVNGKQQNTIAITDRGFQYGDGLFETIEIRQNTPIFLEKHLQRLNHDSKRLLLPTLELNLFRADIFQLCQNAGDAVLKIIVTRGSGGRGYRQPDEIQITRILSLHPFPNYPKHFYTDGIVTRICRTRLGLNPTLAGMKHLNRLEQIMARAEWNDAAIHEGIMLDFNGRVIEGTMTNLFYVKNDELFTASLKLCGIMGIIHNWICEQISVIERDFFVDDLLSADEVFVCNSIMGICGVRQIENHIFKIGEMTQRLQFALEIEKQKQVLLCD